jgi:hypothetical protein
MLAGPIDVRHGLWERTLRERSTRCSGSPVTCYWSAACPPRTARRRSAPARSSSGNGFALPDGETGPRAGWVSYERERLCRPNPDVVLVQETESPTGIPRHAYEMPIFAVRDGASDVHWKTWPRIDDAIASYGLFCDLREQGVIPVGLRY